MCTGYLQVVGGGAVPTGNDMNGTLEGWGGKTARLEVGVSSEQMYFSPVVEY